MRFTAAIDAFIADWRREGRINSDRTEISYRSRLAVHADDVGNRDPRTVGRGDVKRTLAHWPHPNTQRNAHAVLRAFYDWCMEEGVRSDNPARQVRKARARPTQIQRLTRGEVVRLMDASMRDRRERRAIHLGVLAGLRSQEMRGLRGEHLARVGFVHVSADIAKGGRERWVPVLAELEDVIADIVAAGDPDAYLLPGRHPANPPRNTEWRFLDRPMSAKALWEMVVRVGVRAGIATRVYPHLLRHAYGDHVAKYAGLRAAQALLGHQNIETTTTYTGHPTLDELQISVHGFSYRGYPPAEHLEIPDEATTGIEPVEEGFRSTTERKDDDDER